MSTSLPRLDLTQIFGNVDDFYRAFEAVCQELPQLPYEGEAKPYRSRLSLIAYSYYSTKPSLDLTPKELDALPPAIF